MCGIVGIAGAAPVPERAWLAAGCEAVAHRGPDAAGEWWTPEGHVGLAHRRLSIIDLSPAGAQPMSHDAGLHLVFNGEIYNFASLREDLAAHGHAFRSRSDTEVILAAYREWGASCLPRFDGMFALALYDAPARRLLLARDRAGEKPLFYRHAGRALRFASELKALLADQTLPRRVDPRALDCYLAMGFVPGDGCILEGFRKLPPAHALEYDLASDTARVWRYWELPQLDRERATAGALVEELDALLESAVRRQMVADVPVGILLSGGMDSSLITAMASRTAPAVRTFTIRFPGAGRFDETPYARLIAGHFGTDHTEIDAPESTVDLLPRLARHFDEPIIDSSMVPTYLVSRAIRAHCAVALGGDGGDELFGGYRHYSRLLALEQQVRWVPPVMRPPLRVIASHLPPGFTGRNWLAAAASDLDRGVPMIAAYFAPAERRRLMGDRDWPIVAEAVWSARVPGGESLLERATRMDFTTFMPEDILVKVDRAAMATSLEVRAPLLDRPVIEFAFGRVPASLKASPSARKILLRKLAARVLPASFDADRKQGFSLPLRTWLGAGPWRAFFEQVLFDPGARVDRGMARDLLAGIDRGRNNSERLFGLVMLELWRREYRVEVQRP